MNSFFWRRRRRGIPVPSDLVPEEICGRENLTKN
jgi:hypothetical protein